MLASLNPSADRPVKAGSAVSMRMDATTFADHPVKLGCAFTEEELKKNQKITAAAREINPNNNNNNNNNNKDAGDARTDLLDNNINKLEQFSVLDIRTESLA